MAEERLEWCFSVPELSIDGDIPDYHTEFMGSGMPIDLTGKSVLDLGSWDGYHSFMAIKRGAEIVVAIDNGVGEEIMFGPDKNKLSPGCSFPNPKERKLAIKRLYKKYRILNDKLGANINFIPMDIMDIDKILMKFDIILCLGVFYHVKNIYGLLEKCYERLEDGGSLVAEGHISEDKKSIARFIDAFELNNDPTNYWSPSESCLKKMLLRIGFKTFETINLSPIERDGRRILLRARK